MKKSKYLEAVKLLKEYYENDYLWCKYPKTMIEDLDRRTRKCLEELGEIQK